MDLYMERAIQFLKKNVVEALMDGAVGEGLQLRRFIDAGPDNSQVSALQLFSLGYLCGFSVLNVFFLT